MHGIPYFAILGVVLGLSLLALLGVAAHGYRQLRRRVHAARQGAPSDAPRPPTA